MHSTKNYENVNQTLQHKATSDDNIVLKEEVHNKQVLVEELNGAEQEIVDRVQYTDNHDYQSRLHD